MDMPREGREIVDQAHGDQDMEHAMLLPTLTGHVPHKRWLPVGCSTNDDEPEGGCTAA